MHWIPKLLKFGLPHESRCGPLTPGRNPFRHFMRLRKGRRTVVGFRERHQKEPLHEGVVFRHRRVLQKVLCLDETQMVRCIGRLFDNSPIVPTPQPQHDIEAACTKNIPVESNHPSIYRNLPHVGKMDKPGMGCQQLRHLEIIALGAGSWATGGRSISSSGSTCGLLSQHT